MDLFALIFGRAPHAQPLPRLNRPPHGVKTRAVRPRRGRPVEACLAERDGALASPKGVLQYQAGRDYLVQYGPHDRAPVHRAIFKRTYERRPDGRFQRRTDIVLRYFTLPYPVIVETLEGDRCANPRDWIMIGPGGEIWPVAPEVAKERYRHV